VAHLLIALLAVATFMTSSAAGFEIRAAALEQRFHAASVDGVPDDLLAPVRADLTGTRDRRAGSLPYELVSGAAFNDPFTAAESDLDAAYRTASADARQRAEDALGRLQGASGPMAGAAELNGIVELARARTPAAMDRLATKWNARAAGLEAVRQSLSTGAGGLQGGLPADVTAAAAHLQDLMGRAGRQGIPTADASGAVARAQMYLTEGYPELLAGHDLVLADIRAATSTLQHRLDLRQHANDLLAAIPDLLDQAVQYGAGDDFKARVDQVRTHMQAAKDSTDPAALDSALADLQKLSDDLDAAGRGFLPTAGIPCQPAAPAQMIIIHLATQQLVAYDKGCPMLRTPVTTGRPALPTGRGTFHIFYKAVAYHMISPWPQGNPFYYPPTWVGDAMEFIGDGTFLHSADWQPDSTYGPGSEYGPYASHGCVHVIPGPLQQLYDWASIGATVVVGD
jgi:lipoprotein-anchoring transpeptidase ErfK/SrfK